MSVSVSPKLVIGVKSSMLVRSEVADERFEIHDERGTPTGKFKSESTKTFYLINQPNKKVKDKGYIDDICWLLDVDEYPNDGEFGFHPTAYETNDYLQTGIVGICVASLSDVMYGSDIGEVGKETIETTIDLVKRILRTRYGAIDVADIEPSIFLYADVG